MLPIESVDRPVCTQERLLDQILRIGGVPGESKGNTEEHLEFRHDMAGKQRLRVCRKTRGRLTHPIGTR